MKKYIIIAFLALGTTVVSDAAEKTVKVKYRYMNFPVSQQVDRKPMSMSIGNHEVCRFVIRLTDGQPEYWVFQDMQQWQNKTVKLRYDGSEQALNSIVWADSIIGQSRMYHEEERPQYHFTSRRGWINDPNGMIYYNGYYHLFYQHNPYECEWENMHWGHAVSKDMVHWEEWADVLHPDTIGTIFSGTSVVDHHHTAGFGTSDKLPALVAFYTADHPQGQRQCMAYSVDGGMTFTKYQGNPVINSKARWNSNDTRDPKVFWHDRSGHWVMVLNERDGHSIYTSDNLKDWEYRSHLTGFWECPDLFELPVEGTDVRKWVLWGASGTYAIGQFDGYQFIPDGPKLKNMNGAGYAAQTFGAMPQGDQRVVKMTWGRIKFNQMPFNGVMLLPQEQTLKQTSQGVRLFSRPVKEIENLCERVLFKTGTPMTADEANELLAEFADNDQLRIKATLRLTYAVDAGLSYNGERLLTYDMNGNLLNGSFYSPDELGSMLLHCDVYIDKSVVEGFIDDGAFSFSMKRGANRKNREGYRFWGRELIIENLEVYKVNSIFS